MTLREYRKVSKEETKSRSCCNLHKHDVVHTCANSKNCCAPRIHQEYEYFQLYDPDDSDIDEEVDADVRSLLVGKITTYTRFSQPSNKPRCCFRGWYVIIVYQVNTKVISA